MPRTLWSIPLLLLSAAVTACTFDARGLPYDGGGEGISWYRDGAFSDRSLYLDFGKPSVACKVACPLGCHEALKRCYRIKPSNFHSLTSDTWFDDMTADVGPTSGLLVFDTDTGKVTEGSVERRPAYSKGQALNGVYWNLLGMPKG